MNCPNCSQARQGPFCGSCGQNDRNYQRALPPVLSDLLRETFELDSRLLRTMGNLLFKPGELALEFSRNRRASYVSPIRLYLFVSLLFFFLLSLTTDFDLDIDTSDSDLQQLNEEVEAIADADASALMILLGESRRAKAEELLANPDSSLAKLILLQVAEDVSTETDDASDVQIYLLRQLVDVLYEPRSALNQLIDNLPLAIFVMLPVYALLLKLFYLRKGRFYVENLVFATHLHTFLFLIFTILLLLPENTGLETVDTIVGAVTTCLILLLAVYHYTALKRYFQDGYVATAFKFLGLMFFYLLLLSPAALSIVVIFTLITV